MEKAKLRKDAIVDIFDLKRSGLYDFSSDEKGPVNLEEVSGHDMDTLWDMLCDEETFDMMEFYTNFVKEWGSPDDDYEIIMSNMEDENELTLSTVLNDDTIIISRDERFTSVDLFNILNAINSQTHFYDLYVITEKDGDTEEFSGTLYHRESFVNEKTWVSDFLEMFREGEFDYFHTVHITSNFDELDLGPVDGVVRDNRLYVMFYLNY